MSVTLLTTLGIGSILKVAGDFGASDAIDSLWNELKELSASIQPQGYSKRYPTRLLEALAQGLIKHAS